MKLLLYQKIPGNCEIIFPFVPEHIECSGKFSENQPILWRREKVLSSGEKGMICTFFIL